MINMVFPPVDSLIQEKIITAHLAGKGRNQIWRNLNEQGLRVSSASVTNIINRHKRRQRETSSIVATTNTAADQNKDGSPSFNSRSILKNLWTFRISHIPSHILILISNLRLILKVSRRKLIRLKRRTRNNINPNLHYECLRINQSLSRT
jgi:hypothetical protein